jgi:hypothetical protein
MTRRSLSSRRRDAGWRRAALCAPILWFVFALACGTGDESSHQGAEAPNASSQDGMTASPEAPSAFSQPAPAVDPPSGSGATPEPTAEVEGPDLPAPPARRLEDLVRLPAPIAESHIGHDPLDASDESDVEEPTDEEEKKRPVGVDVEGEEDQLGFDGARSHRRTEAGVSVGVDEKTSIRGGVRIEQETGQKHDEPIPTVGIEQQF